MNTTEFENTLREEGCTEIFARGLPAGHATTDHSHAFNVRALVTAGEITLTCGGEATVYRAGDVFVMPAGQTHFETVGADGVAYVVGKR